MARQIVVDIVGDAGKFKSATAEATKTGRGFGNVIKGVGVGIGLGLFDVATSAISGFVGALDGAQQAYRDDQVSQAKLRTALKNNVPAWNGSTAAIEKYAGAQARLGFEDDAVRDSIGTLIGITHNQTRAMELNSMAQDLARAKGISLEQATDAVSKAAQGNGRALKSLGIDISGATDAAGFLDAIQKNVKGSAEAWADTSEGRAAAANVKNAESWEKIGGVVDRISSVLLPIAADAFGTVAEVISTVATAIEPVVSSIVAELTPAFETAMGFLNGTVIPVVQQLTSAILPVIGTVIRTVTGIWKAEFAVIGAVIRTAVGIVGPIVGGLVGTIRGIGSTIGDVAGSVGAAVGRIVGFFTGVGGQIGNATRGMWDGIWGAFRSVINAVIRGWNSLKFTIPAINLGPLGSIGGFTIGTPDIPYLHAGGIVPGLPGSDVAAILQAGERVIPRDEAGGRGVTVNIYGPVYGDRIDELTRTIAARLRVAG